MVILSNLVTKFIGNVSQTLVNPTTSLTVFGRFASKKASGVTKNYGNSKPKHRGWKKQDGHQVTAGTILVTQNSTRFHPGLNVGFGRNGTLWAIHPGKVVVTCEKVNLKWNHPWIEKYYAGREGQTIYKKHFNVIPEPQHKRFKLINKI